MKENVDEVGVEEGKTGEKEDGVKEVRTSLTAKKFKVWREIKVRERKKKKKRKKIFF